MNRRDFLKKSLVMTAGGLLLPQYADAWPNRALRKPGSGSGKGSGTGCMSGNDANTTLLIHSNTTEGDTTFLDSGKNALCPHVITANGDVHHTTTQKVWGSSSIAFDGTGDFLTVTHGGSFDLSSSGIPWTIDGFVKFASVAIDQTLFWQDGTYLGIGQLATGNLSVRISNGHIQTWAWIPVVGTWYHLAVVRSIADDVIPYIDGVALGAAFNANAAFGSFDIQIGGNGTSYAAFNGYMDEIRISNVARWTGNFTKPFGPYCD